MKIRTQEEVIRRFMPLLQHEGKVCRKNVSSYIRKAKRGEHIVTLIDGKQETQYIVEDDTSWVVCGKAAGEYYVLSDKAFHDSYDESSATPIPIEVEETNNVANNDNKDDQQGATNHQLQQLRQEGFVEYHSKRKVYARRADEQDMEWFRYGSETTNHHDGLETTEELSKEANTSSFEAPWGESMRVDLGDYLVMQYPSGGNDEVYRIEYTVFGNSYVSIESNDTIS